MFFWILPWIISYGQKTLFLIMVNFLRTQVMKKSETWLTASSCLILKTLCCKISKFNPYRRKISRQVTPRSLYWTRWMHALTRERQCSCRQCPCRDNASVFTCTSGRGSLTLLENKGYGVLHELYNDLRWSRLTRISTCRLHHNRFIVAHVWQLNRCSILTLGWHDHP